MSQAITVMTGDRQASTDINRLRWHFIREYLLDGSPGMRRLFLKVLLAKLMPESLYRHVSLMLRPRYPAAGRPGQSAYPAYRRMQAGFGIPLPSELPATGITRGLVSVVLPVYNQSAYLREAIDGVLTQSYRNLELIIVDDGSTDGSGAIADDARSDPRVRVIHQDNRGLPGALNRGIMEVRGEFTTWTSGDNRCLPVYLERLTAFLRQWPEIAMVFANYELIDSRGGALSGSRYNEWLQVPHGAPLIQLPWDTGELNFVPLNIIGPCFLYRTAAAATIGLYDPAWAGVEDYDYWMRMNTRFRIAHLGIAEPLYQYRVHRESLTGGEENAAIGSRMRRLVAADAARRRAMAGNVQHVQN